jgi:lipoate-protein ligase A
LAAIIVDVERFRSEPRRVVVAREVTRPTLVLGSTQRDDIVGVAALRRGVDVVHRRGGGGAVYLGPGTGFQLWLDAWIPRDDPLWMPDVSLAAEWVGKWWISALAALVGGAPEPPGLEVHRGRLVPGAFGNLVCFAGRGPGEVLHHGRKLVGVSQWRARQGALFSSCAYWRWDPAPLLELLEPAPDDRARLVASLESAGVGLAELPLTSDDPDPLQRRLLGSFPGWGE